MTFSVHIIKSSNSMSEQLTVNIPRNKLGNLRPSALNFMTGLLAIVPIAKLPGLEHRFQSFGTRIGEVMHSRIKYPICRISLNYFHVY